MRIIFMGTGTSQGVPLIADDNPLLDLNDARNWRGRSSIHVDLDGCHIQVDAAPEFRLQCLRENIRKIDRFILTHGHADHIAGMDDLRRFCDLLDGHPLPVYATPSEGIPRIQAVFPYALGKKAAQKGYPCFDVQPMPDCLEVPSGKIYSTLLPHGVIQVLGLVFVSSKGKKVAYYCDCHAVPPKARELAYGADALIIDGLRHEPHATHLTIAKAVQIGQELAAKHTYLTHMGATIDHARESALLPAGASFAYDGLVLDF
jgi:phosphoribosyl 1,2-cyclic phosphate phosphodiesterase